MNIVHISDIHLTVPGEEMAGLDTHARLAAALDHMQAHIPEVERLIITGDLAHWGEREAYEALRHTLANVDVPVRLMIGNHDDRTTFLEVFDDHPVDANGYVNHAESMGDTRLIYLDSTAPLTHAGHFGPDRLAWLEAELEACTHARIFLHHNPMELGLPAMDKIGLVQPDRDALRALIHRYAAKIDHIHFGHVHAQISGSYQGVPFTAVQSTGHQSFADLLEPDWLIGAPMQPWFHAIRVTGRDTTVLPIAFSWDGPVSRSGTEWEDWAKPEVAAQ